MTLNSDAGENSRSKSEMQKRKYLNWQRLIQNEPSMPLYHVEDEKDRHIAAIIRLLNEVDDHAKQLRDLQSAKNRHPGFIMQDATEIFEKCFFKCQVAEDLIKQGYTRAFLKRQHKDDLNRQLGEAVRRILDRSRESELLMQVLRERFGMDVSGQSLDIGST